MSWRRWLAWVVGVPVLALLALCAWGLAEALRDPVVARYDVGIERWPAGTPPMRVVQISDLHVSWPDMPLDRVGRIVRQVNALQPDLVVLTGDYLGGKVWDPPGPSYDAVVQRLGGLRARYGVVAVRGNHDSYYWSPIVFGRSPIRLLTNQWVAAGPIIIAGADDMTGPFHPSVKERMAVAGAPADRPLIMLGHEPEFFNFLPQGADLMIAGHTHGAQIVLPLLGYRSMSPYLDAHRRGLFEEHGQRMIVSSGVGTSIVPFRIGVPPEVALIVLGPATR